LGKIHEFGYSVQMAVVCIGECPFEVKVAEENVFLVGVSILYPEA